MARFTWLGSMGQVQKMFKEIEKTVAPGFLAAMCNKTGRPLLSSLRRGFGSDLVREIM